MLQASVGHVPRSVITFEIADVVEHPLDDVVAETRNQSGDDGHGHDHDRVGIQERAEHHEGDQQQADDRDRWQFNPVMTLGNCRAKPSGGPRIRYFQVRMLARTPFTSFHPGPMT